MPRKLILKLHQSLDGYICTPQGDVSWIFADYCDEMTECEVAGLWNAGLHIMGRGVYEDMVEYWPTATDVYAPPMNEIPKLIFSGTVKSSDWQGTSVTDEDLETAVIKLKQEDGKLILAHGGARFAQSLSRLELVDEYHLFVHPQTLGEGVPCFSDPVSLELADVHRFETGALMLTYLKK
jgi:dihydrofolate reductase